MTRFLLELSKNLRSHQRRIHLNNKCLTNCSYETKRQIQVRQSVENERDRRKHTMTNCSNKQRNARSDIVKSEGEINVPRERKPPSDIKHLVICTTSLTCRHSQQTDPTTSNSDRPKHIARSAPTLHQRCAAYLQMGDEQQR